jgi:hypothetical protein
MVETPLARAIDRFASVTHGLSDAALERKWTWEAYDEGVRFAFFRTYEELCESASTLATERAAQGPAMTTAQRVLAQYHAACRDLQAVLIDVEDASLDRLPAEAEWPLRIILGHVIGVEREYFARTWYAVDQWRKGNEQPIVMPDEDVEAFVGSYDAFEQTMDNESLGGILAHYAALHERVLHELADIGEDELNAPSLWWESYAVPVQYRLQRFDSHLRQHTIQVEKTLAEERRHRLSEAKQILRLVYGALAEAEGVTIGAWDFAADRWDEMATALDARTDEIAEIVGK